MGRNTLAPLFSELALKREQGPEKYEGYQKVLVPLDGSVEAELILAFAPRILASGGEVILLQVIPPGHDQKLAEVGARQYLSRVLARLTEGPSRWRWEVIVSQSVAMGIADFAAREDVGLIVMYTHDRNGVAKLSRGRMAKKVQERSPVNIRELRMGDLSKELHLLGAVDQDRRPHPGENDH